MRNFISIVVLALAVSASPATAGMLNRGAQKSALPTCKVAEVNPVTGNTECIEPLGAPVEAPPPSEAAPCQANSHSDGSWSYQPNCKSTPPG